MAREGRDPRADDTRAAAEDEAPPPDDEGTADPDGPGSAEPRDEEATDQGYEGNRDEWPDEDVERHDGVGIDDSMADDVDVDGGGPAADDTDESLPSAADVAREPSTRVGEVDPGAHLDAIPEGVDDLVADPGGLDGLRDLTDEGVADLDTRGGDGLGERPDVAGTGAFLGEGGTGAMGPGGVGAPQHDPDALRAEFGGGTRHDFGGDEPIEVPSGVMDEAGLGPEETEPSGATAGLGGDLAGSGSPLDDGTAGGRPGMPEMADVVDDGPAKPGIEETRALGPDIAHYPLDDGSRVTVIDGEITVQIDGGWAFGGTSLTGQAALDHASEHLPLEPIPSGDDVDPESWVDPAVRERLMAELEENTQYSEATWAAWQGRHVNPDPGAEGGGTTDPPTDPFHQPDFADPADETVGSAVPITQEDVDPGTVDPLE